MFLLQLNIQGITVSRKSLQFGLELTLDCQLLLVLESELVSVHLELLRLFLGGRKLQCKLLLVFIYRLQLLFKIRFNIASVKKLNILTTEGVLGVLQVLLGGLQFILNHVNRVLQLGDFVLINLILLLLQLLLLL